MAAQAGNGRAQSPSPSPLRCDDATSPAARPEVPRLEVVQELLYVAAAEDVRSCDPAGPPLSRRRWGPTRQMPATLPGKKYVLKVAVIRCFASELSRLLTKMFAKASTTEGHAIRVRVGEPQSGCKA